MYLVLSLKYRPKDFSEVVGQEHVVLALKRALIENRVGHAYLFSGPRGVGKTSMARILAKSLNCLKYSHPTPEPCNQCVSCQEITQGRSLDVIEIDGASNRGIDEIRQLREDVKLLPVKSRFKVYIIDEVHQITQDAFNALLKTLEEPPSHVKFIFATTHPQKVIPTILSRCQKFQFHLLSAEEVVKRLKYILAQENIDVHENLLYSIAYTSGGSIRDAESLLDQIIPVVMSGEPIEDVLSFLGVIEENSLNYFIEQIVKKDIENSIVFIDKIIKEGKDLSVFIKSLLEHLRLLILWKVNAKEFEKIIDVSITTKEFFKSITEKITLKDILIIIDYLIEAQDTGKKLDSLRIPLEIAVIKYALKDEKDNPTNIPFSPFPKTIEQRDSQIVSSKEKEESFLSKEIEKVLNSNNKVTLPEHKEESELSLEKTEVPDKEISIEEFQKIWVPLIQDISRKRMAIASYLSEGVIIDIKNNVVNLGFHSQHFLHKEILEKPHNKKYVEEKLKEHTGIPLKVRYTTLKESTNMGSSQESIVGKVDKEQIYSPLDDPDDEMINKIMDTFDGKISSQD